MTPMDKNPSQESNDPSQNETPKHPDKISSADSKSRDPGVTLEDIQQWLNTSFTAKIISIAILVGVVCWLYHEKKFEGDAVFYAQMTDGSVQEVMIRNSCGKILDKAASGKDLTDEDIQKLHEFVPRNDAVLVYGAMRAEWHRARGWEVPALIVKVNSNAEEFANRYYGPY